MVHSLATVETAFHADDAEAVMRSLGTDPDNGLSEAEARKRLAALGPNVLLRQKQKSVLAVLLHQLKGVVVWLLGAAALLSLFMGDRIEAAAILLVLLINTAIGFFTELRALRSMEALFELVKISARVCRDGAIRLVDATTLVQGDIVLLDAGDMVTADMRLIATSHLEANEAVITGEALPVAKSESPAARDAIVAERTSMVFKGSAISRGTARAVVVATGMDTEIGKIAKLSQEAHGQAPPLERRLDRLGRKLVWLTLAVAAVTVALGILQGLPVPSMIQTGVALAVAAIPEGLPIVATLCLARGMLRMARRNALVNRLSAVETLGATTLIATDKTGTLTENRMEVVRYLLPTGDVAFDQERGAEGETDDATRHALDWALTVGDLCNTAALEDDAGGGGRGDPMELALKSAAQAQVAATEIGDAVIVHAFDPDHLMMSTVHPHADGFAVLVKGAPEAVLDHARAEFSSQGEIALDDERRAMWLTRTEQATALGWRCLALAFRHSASSDEDPYAGLTLIGITCFADPLRDDVAAAIAACRAADIDVVMITGDHPETARAIAYEAGICGADADVVVGRDLSGFEVDEPDSPLVRRVLASRVFARISPEQKLSLVHFFQNNHHVVAMTGDGVNDAPALRKADIGVAMGQRGTQVAREAADMVLLDDAFSTIVEAVHQGRIIFENIRKFVVYLMSCNLSEVLVVGLAVGSGLPVPLLPLQILFLNLVTDIFPAFALGLARGGEGTMQAPPRDPEEPIITRRHWLQIGILGATIAVATLATFVVALSVLELGQDRAISAAFLTIALAQLWNVFNVRGARTGIWINDVTTNAAVWIALAFCIGLIAVSYLFPSLSDLLSLPVPGRMGTSLAIVSSLAPLLVGQILHRIVFDRDAAPNKLSD